MFWKCERISYKSGENMKKGAWEFSTLGQVLFWAIVFILLFMIVYSLQKQLPDVWGWAKRLLGF